MNKEKLIPYISPIEAPVMSSTKPVVACTGPHATLGHPRVFLSLKVNEITPCPYCSQQFIYVEK